MALGWKNITVARTNCGADVFGLAGFLGDDDLICQRRAWIGQDCVPWFTRQRIVWCRAWLTDIAPTSSLPRQLVHLLRGGHSPACGSLIRHSRARLIKEHIENRIWHVRSSDWGQAMAEVTYFVALPFVAADDGIAAGEPTECFNPNAAVMRAETLSRKEGHVGAVAFSRSGDPATDEISALPR